MSYLTDQIEVQKQIITAISTAILELSSGGVVSYELDTGQNKTKVTRQDIATLTQSRTDALNYLAELERAAGLSQSYVYGVPSW